MNSDANNRTLPRTIMTSGYRVSDTVIFGRNFPELLESKEYPVAQRLNLLVSKTNSALSDRPTPITGTSWAHPTRPPSNLSGTGFCVCILLRGSFFLHFSH